MMKLLFVVLGLSTAILGRAQGVVDQGYALVPVPEPNILPLTLLGVAAVWLLRRKK
jgi:hypothetical protein